MHLLALGLELAQESAQRLLMETPFGEVLRNTGGRRTIVHYEHKAAAAKQLRATEFYEVIEYKGHAEKYEFEMHCFKGDATKQNMVDNHKLHVATCRTVVIAEDEVAVSLQGGAFEIEDLAAHTFYVLFYLSHPCLFNPAAQRLCMFINFVF